MKKILFFIFAIDMALGFTSCAVGRVDSIPADVAYTRPPAPGPNYVWVGDNWVYRSGSYAHQQGHWETPRPGKTYANGQWKKAKKGGWQWQKGHWHK